MKTSDGSTGFSRRAVAGHLAWPTLFGVTEVWAFLVVLTQVRVAGLPAAALAFVLAGVVVRTWSEWQEIHAFLTRSARTHGSTSRIGGSAPNAEAA
jgi:hypothetical protein